MTGVLHLGGPRRADLNLIVQAALAVAMTVGVICARRKHYRSHGMIEASVVLFNLAMIGALMLPFFPRHLWRKDATVLTHPYYAVVTIHAFLGAIAELHGLYVVFSAGTCILPQRIRLQNYRLGMRTTFVLWWMALLTGGAVYYIWYVTLPR